MISFKFGIVDEDEIININDSSGISIFILIGCDNKLVKFFNNNENYTDTTWLKNIEDFTDLIQILKSGSPHIRYTINLLDNPINIDFIINSDDVEISIFSGCDGCDKKGIIYGHCKSSRNILINELYEEINALLNKIIAVNPALMGDRFLMKLRQKLEDSDDKHRST